MVLVLAAVSVRADDLHLEMMQEELLGGESYSNYSNSSWYIKFSAKVEEEDIVSACEIWTRKEGYLVEVTALKIPYKYTIEVAHMRARVIHAAKTTAKVLKLSQLLPATADDIAEALWNMAEGLGNKTADMGKSQVRFAVMYHSVIIQAALRIMNGAKQTKDICRVSPDYEYAESSSLFICTQDLPHFKNSLLPHHVGHQLRYIRSPDDSDEHTGSGSNEPANQPTRKPTNPPTRKPTNPPTSRTTNQPTTEPRKCIEICIRIKIKICLNGCIKLYKTHKKKCKRACLIDIDIRFNCRSECMHR